MAVAPLKLFAPVFNGIGCDAGVVTWLLPSSGDQQAKKGCLPSRWTGFSRCINFLPPYHRQEKVPAVHDRVLWAGDEYKPQLERSKRRVTIIL